MSIRQYSPRGREHNGASRNQTIVLMSATFLAIGLQIFYPLVHGDVLRVLTIATVYSAAFVAVFHSFLSFGLRFASTFLAVTLIYALTVEAIGVKSGWPFGTYFYDSSLGYQIYGVPLLVPFAWVMLSYPIFVAARRTAQKWVFLYGGLGLMAWDLFLDPQMVNAGRWHWKVVGPHLPFAPNIPLSNSAGWLFAGMGLMSLLNVTLPKGHRKDGTTSLIPNVFLFWSLFAGIVGNAFFFHRPGTACFGGLIFAMVLSPYFFQLRFGRPDAF